MADEQSHYDLTDPEPEPISSRPSLLVSRPENCPNCGQPLPDDESIVCVKCGYDLRSTEIRATTVGKPVEQEPPPPPLTRERISWKVTLAVAGGALFVMVVAYLSGVTGLFPRENGLFLGESGERFEAVRPLPSARLFGMMTYIGQRMIFAASLAGAVLVQAHLRGLPAGNRRSMVAHSAAIASVSGLLLLTALPHPGVESGLELIGQGAVAALGYMTLFRFRPADAVVTLGIAVLGVAIVIGGAHLITMIT